MAWAIPHALAVALRQLAYGRVDIVGDLDRFDSLVDAPLQAASSQAPQSAHVGQVAPNGEVVVEGHRLRKVTDPASGLLGRFNGVEPGYACGSG